MRPVCHLHIGMNKAGSTTIQTALDGYNDGTTEYLQPDGALTATHPLVLGYRDRPPAWLIPPEANSADTRADARAAFEALMARSDRAAIVSSEYLSDFPSVENAQGVLDTVCHHAAEVQIISYLRPPRAFLRSAVQQVLKHNAPPDGLERMWPAYLPRNQRWRKALDGRGDMTCVAFRRDQFLNGDLLTDFSSRTGIDYARLKTFDEKNQSLSLEACAVLGVWHRARAAAGQKRLGHASYQPILTALASFGQTHDWGFSQQVMDQVMGPRKKDLIWAAKWTRCPDFAEEPDAAMVLDGIDDLLSQANGLDGAVQHWAERVAPGAKPKGRDIVSVMDAVDEWFRTPSQQTRSFVQRVKGAALRRLRPTR